MSSRSKKRQQQLANQRTANGNSLSVSGSISEKTYVIDLPDPDDVAKFEELYPGATEIIFDQYKKQGDHRRSLEQKVVSGNVHQQRFAPIYGMIIVLASLGLGTYLIIKGFDTGGLVAIISAIAAPVGVFFGGRILQLFERKEKNKNS